MDRMWVRVKQDYRENVNVIKGLIKESLEQRPFRNYTREFIPIFLKLVSNHQDSWLAW